MGLAAARALLQQKPSLRLLLLEKESALALHQSGRNSGVLHSGVYYKEGSLKAQLCVSGVRLMENFCEKHGLQMERCGKVVVATSAEEIPRLEALYQRGRANGIGEIELIGPERLAEIEPEARGIRAIHLPRVGVVSFSQIAEALASEIQKAGGEISLNTKVETLTRRSHAWVISSGERSIEARTLVNCAGLHANRMGKFSGDMPPVSSIPFRGEYYELPVTRRDLVRGLIYPVPDPALPFLGVHLTRTVDGRVLLGPNAVLAWKREGYQRSDISAKDLAQMLGDRTFWKMAGKYWKTGFTEMKRSWSKRAFLREANKLVPALVLGDLQASPAGVRAQAVAPDGSLVQDFVISQRNRALQVYNAPSPAATASLAIAQEIARKVL